MTSFRAEPAPLTSGNTRVKNARKLARRSARAEARQFLADGPKAVEGALQRAGCVVEVFATPAATTRYADLRAGVPPDVPWTLVDDRASASLSDSVTPQGIVAVCRFLDRPAAQLLAGEPRLVSICADVRDPGNAGTVIRSTDAAGGEVAVLTGRSVDPYNAKTVRASVGSLFRLPLALVDDPVDAVSAARSAGLTVLAADGGGELDLFEADHLLGRPTAWLFGNEAWGLPAELAELADHRVAIPIHGGAESLNLSTAATVCLYASARAQRGGSVR